MVHIIFEQDGEYSSRYRNNYMLPELELWLKEEMRNICKNNADELKDILQCGPCQIMIEWDESNHELIVYNQSTDQTWKLVPRQKILPLFRTEIENLPQRFGFKKEVRDMRVKIAHAFS